MSDRGASWKLIAEEYKSERDALRADVNRARELQSVAEAEAAALRRGEFICRRCGLRKDAEFVRGDF